MKTKKFLTWTLLIPTVIVLSPIYLYVMSHVVWEYIKELAAKKRIED